MESRILDFADRDLIDYVYRDSLVPELFDLLGEELTMELIQIFGGTRIAIPPYKKFLDIRRNLDIFESMGAQNSTETADALAKKYDITQVWVRELYDLMKREIYKIRKFIDTKNKNSEIKITTERNLNGKENN